MSADVEVLRQFLVSLGFRIDEVTQRKFDTTIKKADETALRFGKTLMATAVSAQALVIGFANSFEKLYYLSQRTNTSAADIKAAAAAGKQIGLSPDAIEATLSNISRMIKSDPGVQALIEGITGKSTNGRGIDKVMQDVVRSLSKFPDFVSFDFASQIGIDPDTYLQLKNNLDEYILSQEKNRDMQRQMGVDMDHNAEVLKKYKQELSDLTTKFELLGMKFAEKVLPGFEKLAGYASQTVDNISKLMDLFDKPNPLGTIQKAPVPKNRPKNWFDAVLPESWVSWMTTGDASVPVDTGADKRKFSGKVTYENATPLTGVAGTRGARNNNPGNIEYGPFARSMGATGSDGRFAVFPDMQTGTAALTALMRSYQGRGFNTIDSIVNRYAPASDNNNTGAYGSFLSSTLGVGRSAPLDASHINGLVRGISLYESRFDPNASGITVNQDTNINIVGTGDPALAGRSVSDAQQRVNSDMARNLKGAIR